MKRMRTKLAVGAGAMLAVAGGGVAVAATQAERTPQQESQAIIDDAAKELGVDAAKLREAFEGALENRVDEAVADGRLTAEQGAELKERIGSAGFPLLGLHGRHGGPGGPHGHERGAKLEAAAAFLGVTEAELREQLRAGKTLAEVAKAEGKTVAGLVDALVAAATAELAEAVESGRLTDAQRDRIVESLEERITDRVNRAAPRFRVQPGSSIDPGSGAPPAGEPGHWSGGDTEPPAAA